MEKEYKTAYNLYTKKTRILKCKNCNNSCQVNNTLCFSCMLDDKLNKKEDA